MKCVNKVILVGNITAKPSLQTTNNGQKVATFGLATNRSWMTKGQDKKSSTEFHKVVAWSKLADICTSYLEKGQLVYIEGYLKTRNWEDEKGNKQFKTEIVARDMIRLQKGSEPHAEVQSEQDQEEPKKFIQPEPTIKKEEPEPEVKAEEKPEPKKEENTSSNPIDLDLGL